MYQIWVDHESHSHQTNYRGGLYSSATSSTATPNAADVVNGGGRGGKGDNEEVRMDMNQKKILANK